MRMDGRPGYDEMQAVEALFAIQQEATILEDSIEAENDYNAKGGIESAVSVSVSVLYLPEHLLSLCLNNSHFFKELQDQPPPHLCKPIFDFSPSANTYFRLVKTQETRQVPKESKVKMSRIIVQSQTVENTQRNPSKMITEKSRPLNLRRFGVERMPLKRPSLTFLAPAPDTLVCALQELPLHMKRSIG